MSVNNDLEKAYAVQASLEKKVLSQKGVQGTSVSTMPENHDQVCIKIIVDDRSLSTSSLGLQEKYDGIPVIISYEEIRPM
jgi:hypothetical protein